jgi:hypothetical protein
MFFSLLLVSKVLQGAAASLVLARAELSRAQQAQKALDARLDDTRKKLDEAEAALRLEKAARVSANCPVFHFFFFF